MSEIVVPGRPDEQVLLVGRAAASALDASLREVPTPAGAAGVEAVLEALTSRDAAAAVLRPRPAAWEIARRADVPVLLVPPGVEAARPRLGDVLAPLDGTAAAAAAIPHAAGFARRDLVVLHVLDPGTGAPPFWDQAAHAGEAWADAFLARWCDRPGARLLLRSGAPAEEVLAASREQEVGLIVLGWSRDLAGAHAPVVRRTVAEADVPVLLVPVDGRVPGPSALRAEESAAFR
ncbi:universal stress protein [Actinomycetospora sp. C-140]